ncbi:MAG: hypothetical protein ACI4GW_05345 [Lachnospiraceae bacterium]
MNSKEKNIRQGTPGEVIDKNVLIGVKKEYTFTLKEFHPGYTCLAFYTVH